jgi:hypothetical protein
MKKISRIAPEDVDSSGDKRGNFAWGLTAKDPHSHTAFSVRFVQQENSKVMTK